MINDIPPNQRGKEVKEARKSADSASVPGFLNVNVRAVCPAKTMNSSKERTINGR